MVKNNAFPIIIFAFDRNDYFKQFLESLAKQDADIGQSRPIHLFQDGYQCIFRGINVTEQEKIEESIRLFKSYFPNGQVHYDGMNRNIAIQWRRAEDYIFGDSGNEAAYFFEDDTIIAPYYIRMLDGLTAQALVHGGISYISAFGDNTLALEQQRETANRLIPMKHIWAAAMMREYWLKERPLLDDYYHVMERVPYSLRPPLQILQALGRSAGLARGTAQDSAKETASVTLGYARLTTSSCHAKYIGDRGAHFFPENYKALKFDTTEIYGEPVFDVIFPSPEEVKTIVDNERSIIELGAYRRCFNYSEYFDLLQKKCVISLDDKYFLAVDQSSGFIIPVKQREMASIFDIVTWKDSDNDLVLIKDPLKRFVGLCPSNMILASTVTDKYKVFFSQPAENQAIYLIDDSGLMFRKAMFDDDSMGVLVRGTQRLSLAPQFRFIPVE